MSFGLEVIDLDMIEWVGYAASLIILVSLLMRSLKRLRIVNTCGALIFAVYGLLIGSFPVFLMNAGIALINLYYLRQFFAAKEYFTILPVAKNEDYAKALIDFHKGEIERFMDMSEDMLENSDFRFLILRNMVPAGLFLARERDAKTLEVMLDYATPPYRDFKTGAHIFEKERARFRKKGYERFLAFAKSGTHERYLKRMGFEAASTDGSPAFVKTI